LALRPVVTSRGWVGVPRGPGAAPLIAPDQSDAFGPRASRPARVPPTLQVTCCTSEPSPARCAALATRPEGVFRPLLFARRVP
jgi:hypothetical protein